MTMKKKRKKEQSWEKLNVRVNLASYLWMKLLVLSSLSTKTCYFVDCEVDLSKRQTRFNKAGGIYVCTTNLRL